MTAPRYEGYRETCKPRLGFGDKNSLFSFDDDYTHVTAIDQFNGLRGRDSVLVCRFRCLPCSFASTYQWDGTGE